MGILLAGASFDLFLEKIDSLQRLADSADADNPLYRCVWASLIMPFAEVYALLKSAERFLDSVRTISIHEMLLIRELTFSLNDQSDSYSS